MQKIKDRVTAGIVAGLMANLVKQAVEWTAYHFDISQEVGSEKAADFLLPKGKIKTPIGRAVGVAADSTIAAALGVFGVYVLTLTGKDHYILKGISIGNLTWSAIYGVLSRMGVSSSVYRDPKTTAVEWLAHAAFGITKESLIVRICDPSLFGKPQWMRPEPTSATSSHEVLSKATLN